MPDIPRESCLNLKKSQHPDKYHALIGCYPLLGGSGAATDVKKVLPQYYIRLKERI